MLEEYTKFFLEGKSVNTIKRYLIVVNHFNDFLNQRGLNVDEISHKEILLWINEIEGATTTKRNYLIALNSYFKFLIQKKVINYNPLPEILSKYKVDQPGKNEIRWLNKDEIKKVEREINSKKAMKNNWRYTRNKCIVYMFLYAGLTISELVALTIHDIDIGNSTMIVGPKKLRTIKIDDRVKRALEDWLDERGQQDTPYLFLSQKKGKLSEWAVHNLIKNIAKETEIEDLTAYVLRYTFIYEQIQKGVPIPELVEHLGIGNLNALQPFF